MARLSKKQKENLVKAQRGLALGTPFAGISEAYHNPHLRYRFGLMDDQEEYEYELSQKTGQLTDVKEEREEVEEEERRAQEFREGQGAIDPEAQAYFNVYDRWPEGTEPPAPVPSLLDLNVSYAPPALPTDPRGAVPTGIPGVTPGDKPPGPPPGHDYGADVRTLQDQ